MNDLEIKKVDIFGDTVVAAMDSKGIIWAGINYFCNALGMTKNQRDSQVSKIQVDKTLKRGCGKFPAGVFDQSNETVALRLDFVPIWLSKITITDKMEQDHPELANKLLDYQLKAKDILAEAFMPKTYRIPKTIPEQIQLLAQGNVELNQRVDKVAEDVDGVKSELENLKDNLPILPVEADSIVKAVKKKGVEVTGGKLSQAYRNKSIRQKVYNDIYAQLKRNFDVRSYKAIQRKDVGKAISIVEDYTPPLYLADQIEMENRQIRLEVVR